MCVKGFLQAPIAKKILLELELSLDPLHKIERRLFTHYKMSQTESTPLAQTLKDSVAAKRREWQAEWNRRLEGYDRAKEQFCRCLQDALSTPSTMRTLREEAERGGTSATFDSHSSSREPQLVAERKTRESVAVGPWSLSRENSFQENCLQEFKRNMDGVQLYASQEEVQTLVRQAVAPAGFDPNRCSARIWGGTEHYTLHVTLDWGGQP